MDLDTPTFHLEVCVDRIDYALQALDAGATRIEMNSGLGLDGLTPSPVACRWLRTRSEAPIIAMVRPHAMSFQYSAGEAECLVVECQQLLDAGVDGVAFGAVGALGELDVPLISRVREICQGRELVLHRVFDVVSDRSNSLRQAEQIGVDRILSSGGAQSAVAGLGALARLQQQAESVEFLPGAGINSANAESIVSGMLEADPSWKVQIHGSFRNKSGLPDIDEIGSCRKILESYARKSA